MDPTRLTAQPERIRRIMRVKKKRQTMTFKNKIDFIIQRIQFSVYNDAYIFFFVGTVASCRHAFTNSQDITVSNEIVWCGTATAWTLANVKFCIYLYIHFIFIVGHCWIFNEPTIDELNTRSCCHVLEIRI